MANCIRCGRKLPLLTFGRYRNVCKWCVEYEAMQKNGVDDDARQHVMPTPWANRSVGDSMFVTQIFVGICAAVFVGMALASEGQSLTNPTSRLLIAWGANFGPLTVSGDWWRLITSVFVHIGIIHIAFNMWCLWDLGAIAEALYGHWTFAAVYLISGLAGSVLSVAYHPNNVSAGASGAIFGIAGALIASLKLGRFSMPQTAVKGTLSSVVVFAGYNLIFGAVSGRTDNAAHIGGLLAGLILGALIAVAAPERDHVARRISLLALVGLLVFGGAAWINHARGEQARRDRISDLIGWKQYGRAESELKKKVAANPQDAGAHLQLARVYEQEDRNADQEQELKQVLALPVPDDTAARVRFELASLYVKQQRFADAKKLYTDGLAANPKDLYSRFGLGLLLSAQKDYAGAVEQLEMVAQAEPQTQGLYYDLGRSYAGLKKYDQAIDAYHKAQQLDGNDPGLEKALAEAFEAKGMKQEAEAARRAAEQMQNAPQD